jgi:hypothetical protein
MKKLGAPLGGSATLLKSRCNPLLDIQNEREFPLFYRQFSEVGENAWLLWLIDAPTAQTLAPAEG